MSIGGISQDVIGVIAKNSQEYIEAVFNGFKRGEVVVTLRGNNDTDRIDALNPTSVIEPKDTTGWIHLPDYEAASKSPDSIAQILFTSGTEGQPKGILLHHGALNDTTQRLIDIMEIDSSIREYVGIPIYYSFGFGRIRAISQAGGRAYLPPQGFSPIEISEMLAAEQVNALSAVPTLLRLILQEPEMFLASGSKLRWLEIGSQYLSRSEKEALKAIFPNARIIQHYGLTEASRTTFLKIHEHSGDALESVGQCYGKSEVRLDADQRIQIRGPHVARQMLIDGQLQSLLDEDGWLTTSDRGHLKNDQLFFDGRADDQINCAGVKIAPEILQQQLNESLASKDAIAVTKIDDPLRGDGILIAYRSDAAIDLTRLKTESNRILNTFGVNLGHAAVYMAIDTFPITETGKLQRKKLSELYTSQKQDEPKSEPTENSPGDTGITGKLVQIWEETLKIKPVSQHDSFFDLGGDSLSAIRLSVKMEKMGIPKSVCQEVFRGKTIAQIAGMAEPKNSMTDKLVTLWEETLKIKPVSQHDSFFDLGGDSLSAIRLSVKMEKMGIPKSVCQEVFRGKTIAQIAGLSENTEKKTVLSSASKSIDITRGILVLLVVASHWMPGVMDHLSAQINEINRFLSPLYSAGTPGFAIVFGVGVGFFNLGRFKNHPDSIRPMVIQNLIILAVGISAMALVRYLVLIANDIEITAVAISNQFWSVITYYLLAMLTLPLWLKYLAQFNNAVIAAISLATTFFALHIFVADFVAPDPSSNPLLQTFILIGTAKYNYFEMSAGALLGAALGIWYRSFIKTHSNLGATTPIGLLLIVFSIILSHEMGTGDLWFEWPKPLMLWTWTFYLGVVMLAINTLFYFIDRDRIPRALEVLLNIAATFGTMAFPIFIGHELVLPLREVFVWMNIPFALPIAMLLFLAPMAYYTYKLYHLYFGNHKELPHSSRLSISE